MNPPTKLPVIISVPHCGLSVPREVKKFCRLDLPAILRDGDTWSGYLYNLKKRTLAHFRFALARAVLDPNRSARDRPPENPDGVVKTETVTGEPIWSIPGGLDEVQVGLLLNRYYFPYHRGLEVAALSGKALLGLDCHTMLQQAPCKASHPEEQRPLVCLSNRGGENGEELNEHLTASAGLLRTLGKALEKRLENLVRDKSVPVVSLNRPFRGGYIIRKHSSRGYIPWIQIEFNRSLYLSADPNTAVPDRITYKRIIKLRALLIEALEELFCC